MASEIKSGFRKQASLFQSLSSCEICHDFYKQCSVKLARCSHTVPITGEDPKPPLTV